MGGQPIGPEKTNLKIYQLFCYTKSELKGGLFNEKKCQLMYLGPYNGGRFGQMGVSANQPKLDQLGSLKHNYKFFVVFIFYFLLFLLLFFNDYQITHFQLLSSVLAL